MSTQDTKADTKAPEQIIIRSLNKHGETQEYPRLEVAGSQIFFCRSEDASDRVRNADLSADVPAFELLFDALHTALTTGSYELAVSANSRGTSIKLGGSFAKHTTDAGETVQIKALKVGGASGKTFTVAVEDIDVINGAYKQRVEAERAERAFRKLPDDLESAWYSHTQRRWGGLTEAKNAVNKAERAIPDAHDSIQHKRDQIAELEQEITALVDSLPQLQENLLNARATLAAEESEAEERLDKIVQFFGEYPERAEGFPWYSEVVTAVYERLAQAGEPVPQWMLDKVERD